MLTKITIRNFKRFGDASIDLDNPVVFIGPNNSGKTSAMQALTLWDIGVRKWQEKRAGKGTPEKRPGVTVDRRDLVAIPSPSARPLWKDLRVRESTRTDGRVSTRHVHIEIIVEGRTGTKEWECGLEFYYANEEFFYCRPLGQGGGRHPKRMPIPEEAGRTPIVFLPPMSGLASAELRIDPGAVNVKMGEGRTAEVLRNLCYRLSEGQTEEWESLVERVRELFGAQLEKPRYVPGRGEVTLSYKENGARLDLSASGRGLQQTLLILSFMRLNPGAVLLLDEPDAHLEILRQRQTYAMITEEARRHDSQLVVASHSEVLLGEAAAQKDRVVAFVGKPHSLDAGRAGQVRKALTELGFDQYCLAEQKGWVLYLEGPTDLLILREFAKRLGDTEAQEALGMPFVRYVENIQDAARRHYHGLKEAFPGLGGIALFDRMEDGDKGDGGLAVASWKKREIENYFCTEATLKAYVKALAAEKDQSLWEDDWLEKMRESVEDAAHALRTFRAKPLWSDDTKASDDFLVPLFRTFFGKIGEYNRMGKRDLHELVKFLPGDEIDPEIREKLDAIKRVARSARPHQ